MDFREIELIRLFLKERIVNIHGDLVHERITAKGRLGFFKHKIDHFSYRNYDHHISKINKIITAGY